MVSGGLRKVNQDQIKIGFTAPLEQEHRDLDDVINHALTKLPIAVGFGIKNKKDVKNLSKNADAIVVGSSIIKKVEQAQKKNYNKKRLIENVLNYVKELSSVL